MAFFQTCPVVKFPFLDFLAVESCLASSIPQDPAAAAAAARQILES